MNTEDLIKKTYIESTKGIKQEWFSSDISYWYSYVVNLPKHLQVTYLTVVLENQVLNGGLHQYFVNAYGQFAKETIDALIEIGAFKKSNLLDKALNIVQGKLDDQKFRHELSNKTLKKLFIDDDLFDPLEELDNIYYELEDEDITILLGAYLESNNI